MVFKPQGILVVLLAIISLFAGCRGDGSSKWSFASREKEKAQLATYKQNEKVTQTDGNITPPADLAKSSATTALAQHRLADSGYPSEQIPGYNPPAPRQQAVAPGANYAAVEQMTAQANAATAANATPVAYKDQPLPPLDTNSFPENVPAIVSNPSVPVAASAQIADNSNSMPGNTMAGNSSVDNSPAVPGLPPLPGEYNVPPTNTAVAANSPASANPTVANQDNQVKPAGYISEKEAQSFTPSNGTFLPGSLDVNRYETEFVPPTSSDAPAATQVPSVPNLPKLNSGAGNMVLPANGMIPEVAFSAMSYHQVAQLVSQQEALESQQVALNDNSQIINSQTVESPRELLPPESRSVSVIQTSLVKPVSESSQVCPVAVKPETIAESTPAILMNLTPLN